MRFGGFSILLIQRLFCRIFLFHLSKQRMQLVTSVMEREPRNLSDASLSPPSQLSAAVTKHRKNRAATTAFSHAPLESVKNGDVNSYLMSVAVASAHEAPASLVQPLRGEKLVAEVLFMSRPLIHGAVQLICISFCQPV